MADWAQLPEVVIDQILDYVELPDMFSISKTCTLWEAAVFRPGAWKYLNISGEKLKIYERIFDAKLSRELLQFIETGSRFTKCFKITLCRWFDTEILEKVLLHCQYLKSLEISIWISYTDQNLDHKVSEIVEKFLKKSNTVNIIRMYGVPAKKEEVQANSNTSTTIEYTPIPFGVLHAKHLRELWLVNTFKSHSLRNVFYLINLSELAINPHQLNYSLLLHLASKSLRNLYIVANENTKGVYNEALSTSQWREIRKSGPELRVHCYFSCGRRYTEENTIFKRDMPLKSLVYRQNAWLRYPGEIAHFMTSYSDTLEEFIDYSLTELTYEQGRDDYSFSELNNWIISIAKNCLKLKWLTIKEPLSSAAILLIAFLNPNIKHFMVRDDMIIYQNDVPNHTFPDENTRNIVSINCQSSLELNEKMSEIMNVPWKPYPREEYFAILNRRYQKFK